MNNRKPAVTLTLDAEELAQVQNAAKLAGSTVRAWCRQSVLSAVQGGMAPELAGMVREVHATVCRGVKEPGYIPAGPATDAESALRAMGLSEKDARTKVARVSCKGKSIAAIITMALKQEK